MGLLTSEAVLAPEPFGGIDVGFLWRFVCLADRTRGCQKIGSSKVFANHSRYLFNDLDFRKGLSA